MSAKCEKNIAHTFFFTIKNDVTVKRIRTRANMSLLRWLVKPGTVEILSRITAVCKYFEIKLHCTVSKMVVYY